MNAEDAVLFLVDYQERLMPAMHDGGLALARAARMAEAAAILEVPIVATEQYPKGLGATVPALTGRAGVTRAKTAFAGPRDEACADLLPPGRSEVVLAGCEAHVCVLQTAIDLSESGYRVLVVADASSSRDPEDKAAALDRLRALRIEVVTSEMVLFEWLRDATHPAFRAVQALLR
jgi:nicotinamidase-related amidase